MATRARIGIENADGSITTSYHHWDGYPAGLGFNLVTNWNTAEKIAPAIALGDASSWSSEVGTKVDFNDREAAKTQNIYYGRDRGESNVDPKIYDTYAVFEKSFMRRTPAGEQYAYVLRQDGTWTMINVYGKTVTHNAEDTIVAAHQRMLELVA